MNISKLFEMQKALDERIVREKGLEGQDLLPMKILALQVELGELANEWRGFKYWSQDREPRTRLDGMLCSMCDGSGVYDTDWDKQTDCPLCDGTGLKNPLLEEYVDCLHFVLSIGLDLVHRKPVEILKFHEFCILRFDSITDQFLCLFSDMSELWEYEELDDPYSVFLTRFLELGEMLGFTWDQIEAAYCHKNVVNHQRQGSGY
jgi:dimeric dUTPase (all-alpha-NTP-PPase superfamily)